MAAPRACTVTETLGNGAENYQNVLLSELWKSQKFTQPSEHSIKKEAT